MTIVMRPTCWHQNFGPNGLSAPAQGLCLNVFSSITADFNISSAIRWAIQDQWSSGFVMETTCEDSWSDRLNLVIWTCGSWSECQHDLYFTVQWFCLTSWKLFDICTSYFRSMNQYDLTFDLKINVSHRDVYSMVQWFGLISWRLFDVCISLLWPDVWPQIKYRSLRPIFHGPVMLCYILKTFWCMNIIFRDYGSVWPNIWPQNKYRSVFLSYISNTIWCMGVLFSDNNDLKVNMSIWPIFHFHGLVIFLYIFKIFWWMHIIVGITDQVFVGQWPMFYGPAIEDYFLD